jgi:hypothetical protein
MVRNVAGLEDKSRWIRGRQCSGGVPESASAESYLTPSQIAKMLQISTDTVIRWFEQEPGVLVIGDSKGTRGKRRYRTIRVPESVFQRVLRRRTNV